MFFFLQDIYLKIKSAYTISCFFSCVTLFHCSRVRVTLQKMGEKKDLTFLFLSFVRLVAQHDDATFPGSRFGEQEPIVPKTISFFAAYELGTIVDEKYLATPSD